MKIRLYHPRTGAPLVPIGHRRDGSPIWPILGASPDDDSNDDGPDDGDDADEPGDDAGSDEQDDDGADQLGDAGKKALDRMKAQRNDARRENRELKRQLEEAIRKPDGEDGPDLEQVKADARREAIAAANKRIIRSEVRAAATAAAFNDPADALQYLDLDAFEVDDDGNVDPEEIGDAIAELLKTKPYLAAAQGGKRFQGGADGGPRNGGKNKPPTLDEQIALAQAEKRTRDVISLQTQKLAEIASNQS